MTTSLFRAEKQSAASADRRGKHGKRPDAMFFAMKQTRLYELIFIECSRLLCLPTKKQYDGVKLWREMNDGMAFVHKGCRPDKEFSILGIQVAGWYVFVFISAFSEKS
jgi:hypothetical protein